MNPRQNTRLQSYTFFQLFIFPGPFNVNIFYLDLLRFSTMTMTTTKTTNDATQPIRTSSSGIGSRSSSSSNYSSKFNLIQLLQLLTLPSSCVYVCVCCQQQSCKTWYAITLLFYYGTYYRFATGILQVCYRFTTDFLHKFRLFITT